MSATRLLTAMLALALPACYQQMADTPAYKPLTPAAFFPDGRSARPVVPGTVARGQLRTDTALYQGKGADGKYVTTFPFAMTRDVLERGRERFNIYCSVCHGLTGDADGRIVQRGFTRPPSYWRYETDDRERLVGADGKPLSSGGKTFTLAEAAEARKAGLKLVPALSRGYKLRGETQPLATAPVGYLFEVVTKGYGAMPQLDYQVPVKDRWAIIGYVRALQYAHLPELREKGGQK